MYAFKLPRAETNPALEFQYTFQSFLDCCSVKKYFLCCISTESWKTQPSRLAKASGNCYRKTWSNFSWFQPSHWILGVHGKFFFQKCTVAEFAEQNFQVRALFDLVRKTKTEAIATANHRKEILTKSQWDLKVKTSKPLKRGKTQVTKLRLVLV